MRVFNERVNTNVALNTNVNSGFVPLKSIFMYSMVMVVTGTPTGTAVLQVSNDPETNDTQPLKDPTNWVTMTGSLFDITCAGESMWSVSEVTYNYARIAYTDTSGGLSTATMNVIFNGKGV